MSVMIVMQNHSFVSSLLSAVSFVAILSACTSSSIQDAASSEASARSFTQISIASIEAVKSFAGLSAGRNHLASSSEPNCQKDDFNGAVRNQGLLYKELTARRGLSDYSNATSDVIDQGIVPAGTAVLFYHRQDNSHCVWLIDDNGIAHFESILAPYETPQRLLHLFHSSAQIEAQQISRKTAESTTQQTDYSARKQEFQFTDRSNSDVISVMTDFLLPGQLRTKVVEYDTLVVVPYGSIGTFPFSALSIDQDTAVLDHATVRVAPSLVDLVAHSLTQRRFSQAPVIRSSVRDLRRNRPGCDDRVNRRGVKPTELKTALVVGDPDFCCDPEFDMPQLSGARREAIAVARIFDTRPLIGSAATLEAVQSKMARSDLLYFATHGVSNSADGLNGFIALTKGRLDAQTVQNMCLTQPKVAVLSACQTGLGETMDAGTVGLSRAFQIAGVDDVVMSLWNVDDLATQYMMTEFSAQLSQQVAADRALRIAMKKTRKKYPNPKEWASFTVFSTRL